MTGSKVCKFCKEEKPLQNFCKDKSRPRGFSTECKICANKRGREYYRVNKVRLKDKYLQKRYAMQLHKYVEECEKRQYKCDICQEEANLVVDHDHDTGEVRGLLCSKCNTGLGQFNESTWLLSKAFEYLAKLN